MIAIRYCLMFGAFIVSAQVSDHAIADVRRDRATCSGAELRLRIIDPALASPGEVDKPDSIRDSHFRAFVETVARHVSTVLVEHGACSDTAPSELSFVRLPLATPGGDLARAFAVPRVPSYGACHLSSPWLDLDVERRPALVVRGVVRWNERQFLLDQALLAGLDSQSGNAVEPLQHEVLERLAQDYADTEILGERPSNIPPIEKRLPPDVLWLFQHAWQSTRGPFLQSALQAMQTTTERGEPHYTKLIVDLIDHCLSNDNSTMTYRSILDATDVISPREYVIQSLH